MPEVSIFLAAQVYLLTAYLPALQMLNTAPSGGTETALETGQFGRRILQAPRAWCESGAALIALSPKRPQVQFSWKVSNC